MAAAFIGKLEEIFVCSICLNNASEPKLLLCHHTFCLTCINDLYVKARCQENPGDITCPLCKTVTRVPTGGVRHLPSDFRANQFCSILEDLRLSTYPDNDSGEVDPEPTLHMQCYLCSKGCTSTDVQMLCIDCSKIFCTECHCKHNVTKRYANHVYSSVETDQLHALWCTVHDRFVKAFCMTCKTGVCEDCMLTTHTDHQIENFCQAKLLDTNIIKSGEQKERDIIELLSEAETISKRQKVQFQAVKEHVRKHKLQLIKSLEEQETDIYNTMAITQSQFVENLSQNVDAAKVDLNRLKELKKTFGLVARPLPAAPDIQLDTFDPFPLQIQREISALQSSMPEPPEYTFEEGISNIGKLRTMKGSTCISTAVRLGQPIQRTLGANQQNVKSKQIKQTARCITGTNSRPCITSTTRVRDTVAALQYPDGKWYCREDMPSRNKGRVGDGPVKRIPRDSRRPSYTNQLKTKVQSEDVHTKSEYERPEPSTIFDFIASTKSKKKH